MNNSKHTELANHAWSVADLLRGDYKQSDYGKVILPFTVLRRLDCVLEATKPAVLKELEKRTAAKINPPVPLPSIPGLVVGWPSLGDWTIRGRRLRYALKYVSMLWLVARHDPWTFRASTWT